MSLKLHGLGKITGIDQGLSVVGVTTLHNELSVSGDVVVGGGLTVTGVLTYEDVTNVDSIGIITARSGIVGDLTGNVTGNVIGDITGNIIGSPTLSGISSSIADTAVDIFIYDTSKDSDGGAWRKRTQHTSWYNETLNTATRGSRREFPAVAVIIVETGKVTIYDGDDPDLPMWMVFNQGVPKILYTTATCASMLNGKLVFGTNPNASTYWDGGIKVIDFISEFIRSYSYSFSIENYNLNISQRNDNYTSAQYSNSNGILTNPNVNDVAMTVLSNTEVDSATGLPVPTIAVATDGGVSVIRDDGSVFDITHTTTLENNFVHFIKSSLLTFSQDNAAAYKWTHFVPVPNIDRSQTYSYNDPQTNWYANWGTYGSNDQIPATPVGSANVAYTAIVPMGPDMISFGSSYGLGLRGTLENSPPRMIAHVGSSYNTGYMVGKIKGAFLSETTTGNLSATNLGLITNADFSNGTTGWSNDATPTFTVSGGGVASVDRNGGGATGQCYQTITTEVGRTYTVGVLVSAVSHGFQVYAGTSPSSANILMSQGAINSTGTHYWTFTATTTSTRLDFSATQNVNGTASFDNITIFDGVAGRSVNGKGLQVVGTVNRSAVATGADLVSYGPFSTSNRLRQPYNSGLNFGTNDFSVILWMYNTGSTVHQTLVGRDNREFSVDILDDANYNRKFRIYSFNSSNSLQSFDSNDDPFPLNTWSHVCVNYTNGNTVAVYVNGVLNKSGTLNYDIDDTSNGLNVGCRNTSGSYAHPADATKLALVRISQSAPTAAQVKKMYEDEKFLFQENAKCTLYGSSDGVTAMAYDEDTELLHVGTSAGRSDFQGLRRINNTTTAVTTAISASGELIAEQ